MSDKKIIEAALSNNSIGNVYNAASKGTSATDIEIISAAVPQLILKGKAIRAFTLATIDSPNRRDWMAENYALFLTKGLTNSDRTKMVNAAFKPKSPLAASNVSALAKSAGRVGRLGFSFPIWRFVSQGYGADKKALLEHFGMERLRRDNDVRDESLPFSNPQRDEFGSGFFWQQGQISIEYRRAYIACSIHNPMRPVTLVVRNSSHFFGRDRMPDAAYISFGFKNPDQIKNLTLDDLTGERTNFAPLQNIFHMPAIPSQKARLDSLRDVLDVLDEFDNRLSLWLGSIGPVPSDCNHWIHAGTNKAGGLPQLVDFMEEIFDKAKAKNSPNAPLHLGRIDKDLPAWNPLEALPLDENLLEQLKFYVAANKGKISAPNADYMKNSKHVLLSGPHGDLPLGPKHSAQVAAVNNDVAALRKFINTPKRN
jgi:hypothetical protein